MTDYLGRRSRLVWVAIVAGALTLVVASLFPARPFVYCEGIGNPLPNAALSAFQLARTPEQLAMALGCPARVVMLNDMNRLDLAAFIPAYGAFLLFGAAVLAHGRLRALALALIGAGVIADIVETATQLWIGARWPDLSPAMLPLLAAGSTLKFAGLGLGGAVLGLALLRRQGFIDKLLGTVVVVTSLGSLLLFAGVPGTSLALGVSWVALLLALLLNAIRRPRHSPASAGA
ncbi:MAG TPA: hypothetical protein PK808_02145 [Polymorphobacter sp.]|nr:hypothetical protein [Polymorphobacter sp.]